MPMNSDRVEKRVRITTHGESGRAVVAFVSVMDAFVGLAELDTGDLSIQEKKESADGLTVVVTIMCTAAGLKVLDQVTLELLNSVLETNAGPAEVWRELEQLVPDEKTLTKADLRSAIDVQNKQADGRINRVFSGLINVLARGGFFEAGGRPNDDYLSADDIRMIFGRGSQSADEVMYYITQTRHIDKFKVASLRYLQKLIYTALTGDLLENDHWYV